MKTKYTSSGQFSRILANVQEMSRIEVEMSLVEPDEIRIKIDMVERFYKKYPNWRNNEYKPRETHKELRR